MRSIVLGVLTAVVAMVGCATVPNTPAQQLAWQRWQARKPSGTIALGRVEQDGRLVVTGHQYEATLFTKCVEEAMVDQVRRGVAIGPQPGVLVNIYDH